MVYDIIVLGSLTLDVIDSELKAGGPALYSYFASKILGIKSFICGTVGRDYPWDLPQMIPGIFIRYMRTIRFRHHYDALQRRESRIEVPPEFQIDFLMEGLLRELKPKAIIVNPVFHEFSLHALRRLTKRNYILAVDVQGFLRKIDPDARVYLDYPSTDALEFIKSADIVKISDDEVYYLPLRLGRITVITKGPKGSELYDATNLKIDAPVIPMPGDPTGAGDVFLVGFVGCYILGKSLADSLTCGQALASMLVDPGFVPRKPKGSFEREIDILEEKLPTLRNLFYARVKKLSSLLKEIKVNFD